MEVRLGMCDEGGSLAWIVVPQLDALMLEPELGVGPADLDSVMPGDLDLPVIRRLMIGNLSLRSRRQPFLIRSVRLLPAG